MKHELVKSREEALELLEADLITIQYFIDMCHKKDWALDNTFLGNKIIIENLSDEAAGLLITPPIRLVYSKD
ncbi:hypothetical protein LPC10_18515 [Methylorubrum sp. B1-46]|uniref:hypothetical protein n=1 Tax=Methylorubrum sp. B1-46 TaxID=2897334 RepID=UPI001E374504|nr:hypothetical protein [Methylorubrum sp. B1-46]UGB24895.1 hypothetical protein LPC10_18515 [Methylorubrum sp. B1-46]